MSVRNLYKQYLILCEKWGTDPSRKGRDLGEFIRVQVAKEFSQGETSNIENIKECEEKLQSLNRLLTNKYSKQFPIFWTATFSGLNADNLKEVLSNEGLNRLREAKLGFWEKMMQDLFKKPS